MIFIGGLAVTLGFLLVVHPKIRSADHEKTIKMQRCMVRQLQLTDLCLFTEARYTRHLSQADLYAAFQDHPLSFEHFPSGSLVRPPAHLVGERRWPEDGGR